MAPLDKHFMSRINYLATLTIFALLSTANGIHAQSLEPRAYSNAPIGLNFVVAGFQNSSGALLFDPSLPITDANANVDLGLLGYVRTLDFKGNQAKVGVILPYASLSASGSVDGDFRTRDTRGPGDPTFYFAYNFYGAPALSIEEFRNFQPGTVSGFTIKLTAPLGEYEPDNIINIGTNRWSFEPGIGISKPVGNWTLEASAAAIIYTDNNNFDNGKTRQQDNIYSTQFHVSYSFPRNIWAAVSATYFTGGRTTIEGIEKNDLQENWRMGFTLSLPVNRNHSIKLYGSSGVSQRTGNNYDALGLVWQYRWGAGI
jgi:hypothetical protein